MRATSGYKAEARRISERARARSLLDLLLEARADIRAGADSGLLERERKLELQLRLTPASSKREVEELLAQYREVKAQIRVSSPRYAALTQPIPLTLVEIQRLLDPETLLLEYSLGEARSYLWVVSQAELISCELPKREEVETAVERVYELLTARARRAQGETPAQRQARVAEAEGRAPATKTVAIFADPAYSQSSSRADGMRAPAFSAPQWSTELSKDLIARGVFDASRDSSVSPIHCKKRMASHLSRR